MTVTYFWTEADFFECFGEDCVDWCVKGMIQLETYINTFLTTVSNFYPKHIFLEIKAYVGSAKKILGDKVVRDQSFNR